VVLQVLPDAGGVDDDGDAVLGQVIRGPDAAEHQQLRSVDRAAAQDDLAAGRDVAGDAVELDVYAGGAREGGTGIRREGHATRERVGEHTQIAAPALPGGTQIRVGGGCAGAPSLRHHRLREALAGRQVRRRHRVSEFAGCVQERGGVRPGITLVLDRLRTADALRRVGGILRALDPAEEGGERLPRP
jgi:hypothetical protein